MPKRETQDTSTGQDDIALALCTLRDVAGDVDATPASRSGAARTMLEFYGYLGTGRTLVPDLEAKSNAEMTLSELRRRAAELRKANGVGNPDPFSTD